MVVYQIEIKFSGIALLSVRYFTFLLPTRIPSAPCYDWLLKEKSDKDYPISAGGSAGGAGLSGIRVENNTTPEALWRLGVECVSYYISRLGFSRSYSRR